MQALPKRIVVTPEKTSMLVGTTQRIRGDVLDASDRPIPNAVVNWRVTSDFYDTSSATINAAGILTAVMQARIRVVATIFYSQTVPGLALVSQGDAVVYIQAPTTYEFERIFMARAAGTTSTLAPRAAPLIPTETGGFMFAASLDGLGSALIEWNNGNLTPTPLLTSGRVNPATRYPLATFLDYTRTPSGEILVLETDISGQPLISRGAPGLIFPSLAVNSPVVGAQGASTLSISHNSLADSGAMLISAGYVDAVTGCGLPAYFEDSAEVFPSR
jgi:hypothetical protein